MTHRVKWDLERAYDRSLCESCCASRWVVRMCVLTASFGGRRKGPERELCEPCGSALLAQWRLGGLVVRQTFR